MVDTKLKKTEEKNSALATTTAFLQENSKLGLEEMSQDDLRTPTLSLIQKNATMEDNYGNLLSTAHSGKFYYKGNYSVYEKVEVILLTFNKVNLPSYNDRNIMEQNYKVVGMLLKEKLPFILYCRSTGIGAFKNILTEANSLKRPLWSFITTITAEEQKTEKDGKKFVYFKLKFSVKEMINEMNTLQSLKRLTEKYKTVAKTEEPEPDEVNEQFPDHEPTPGENTESVSADDIPF